MLNFEIEITVIFISNRAIFGEIFLLFEVFVMPMIVTVTLDLARELFCENWSTVKNARKRVKS